MVLTLPPPYGTAVRPPRDPSGRSLWARNPTGPDANDGTRLDATFVNDLIGLIRGLLDAYGVQAIEGDDTALAQAVAKAIRSHTFKVAELQDGDGFVRMTDAERAKLATLKTNYKGAFADLETLKGAYPVAQAGDWAVIMRPGEPAAVALWDVDEEDWVDAVGSPPQTASQVPFTPAGNIEATNVQAALEELDEKKADSEHDHDGRYYTMSEVDDAINELARRRVGEFFFYFGANPPSYALVCDGAEVSRTTYAELWAFAQASGNLAASEGVKQAGQFGPGDGSTTFTLPDLVSGSEFIRAVTTGRSIGTEQSHAIAAHRHHIAASAFVADGSALTENNQIAQSAVHPANAEYNYALDVGGTSTDATRGRTSSVGGTETRPRNIALLPCIVY